MSQLEPLSERNEAEVLDYLASAPYDNVFVEWLIRSRAHRRDDAFVSVFRGGSGALEGVCYFGRQIVPHARSEAAVDAFASRAKSARTPVMIVGPRPEVERFWAKGRQHFPAPRAQRRSQPVYALDRAHLRGSRADAPVARAELADLEEINRNSAAMFEREIGGLPGVLPSQHLERTRRILESGWWWRYSVDRHIVFQCNVGSQTPSTAQLQGVWTPPEDRGKGYATRALAAICDRLLDENPTVCLFVNDFNKDAIALYERVGFFRAGEFATFLF
jgi:RimJ/RimL family protein N-acetyltransferase